MYITNPVERVHNQKEALWRMMQDNLTIELAIDVAQEVSQLKPEINYKREARSFGRAVDRWNPNEMKAALQRAVDIH